MFKLDYGYYLDLCPDRVHVLGYSGEHLVSHALWLKSPFAGGRWPLAARSAYVEGVATTTPQRGYGYGTAVMRRLQAGISSYDLGALSPALPEWYARLGWEASLWPAVDPGRRRAAAYPAGNRAGLSRAAHAAAKTKRDPDRTLATVRVVVMPTGNRCCLPQTPVKTEYTRNSSASSRICTWRWAFS